MAQGFTLEQLQGMGAKPIAQTGVGFTLDQLKGGTGQQQPQASDIYARSAEAYHPAFPAASTDTGLVAGVKATGNVIPSAWNMVKGIGSAISHPLDTIKNIGQVAAGGIQEIPGVAGFFNDHAKEGENNAILKENRAKFDALSGFLHDRYGSVQNMGITATNDPFGFGTDILSLISGGAALADKAGLTENAVANVGKAIDTVGGAVTDTVGKAVGATAEKIGQVGQQVVGHETGLAPATLDQITANPAEFSKEAMANNTREALSGTVKDNIDSRLGELSDLGKGYETIRTSPNVVTVPEYTIKNILDSFHINLDDTGKIVTNAESLPMSTGDRNALQGFLDTFGKEQQLSGNAFLNARQELSNMSKLDSTKTSASTTMARKLRSAYDDLGKEQLPGLKNLDAQYAPEKQLLERIKKDYIDAAGNLKDTAMTKIANATNKGREAILSRLEQIVPGISEKVKIIKAIEDIKNLSASGVKVGAYTRGAVGGFAVSGGNPIGAIIGAIVASPEIAVPLIRAYGLGKAEIGKILEELNSFKVPGRVTQAVQDAQGKGGLSIQDVSGGKSGYADPLLQEARKGDYLYHGTNDQVLESISKEGLRPGRRGLLSLSRDEDYSKSFAKSPDFYTVKKDGVMFRVKADLLNGKTVTSNKPRPVSDQLHEVLTKQTIPPEALEVYKNGEWKPLVENPLLQEARKYKSAEELKPYIGSDGKITLYHGSNTAFDKSKADYGTFLTANKQEALDYAQMRAKGRGGSAKVSEIKLDPSEVRHNQSTGEFQYIGKSKSLAGKYPQEIYKAYNDVNASNLTAKEIDKLPLEDVRGNASMGLEGGKEEFDTIYHQATGGENNPAVTGRGFGTGAGRGGETVASMKDNAAKELSNMIENIKNRTLSVDQQGILSEIEKAHENIVSGAVKTKEGISQMLNEAKDSASLIIKDSAKNFKLSEVKNTVKSILKGAPSLEDAVKELSTIKDGFVKSLLSNEELLKKAFIKAKKSNW